jgi:hypothetical protein
VRGGTIVVALADDGVHRIDDRGHLLLPAVVRRWCHPALDQPPKKCKRINDSGH